MQKKTLFPLVIFVLIVGFLAIGLNRDPSIVPSPLIGKPAPEFNARTLLAPQRNLTGEDLKGKVWMLNIWASWCVSCRQEHPLLLALQREQVSTIVGLNYKDKAEDAKNWLQEFENPYAVIAVDDTGDIGIDFGVYGVPETFVIDQAGVIRYKHVGPLTAQDVTATIKPLIAQLEQADQ